MSSRESCAGCWVLGAVEAFVLWKGSGCGARDLCKAVLSTLDPGPQLQPRRVIVLEDSDLVHLKDGAYSLFNASDMMRSPSKSAAAYGADDGGAGGGEGGQREVKPLVAVERALQTLEMEVSQIMKGGFDHYMQVGQGREAGPAGAGWPALGDVGVQHGPQRAGWGKCWVRTLVGGPAGAAAIA